MFRASGKSCCDHAEAKDSANVDCCGAWAYFTLDSRDLEPKQEGLEASVDDRCLE